jgi:transglutaminase-like putative cysteine protease
MLPVFSAFGQSVKTATGEDVLGSSLKFDGKTATLMVGSETRRFSREEIKNVSFSRREREKDLLATASAEAEALFAHARKLHAAFPDSVDLILRDEGTFIYHPDGTWKIRIREAVFAAKEEALGGANLSMGFEPNRSRIKILHAVSLHPDGSVFSLTEDQITQTKGSSGGEFFSQNEVLSGTIPNVKVGTIYDYAYEIDTYNPFDPKLFQGSFTFQGTSPVGKTNLQVILPAGMELNFVTAQMPASEASPKITKDEATVCYQWEFTDVPPIIPEVNMPPFREVAPNVFFTIQKDWTYLFGKLRPMFEKRFLLTDVVRRKVDEITLGAASVEEKIARVYQFCQKEIRYISIKGNLASGQVGHPAEETLAKQLGDCADKGMLMATMLRHIGVEAYPVGILTNNVGRGITSIPIFDANHCIVEIHLNGKRFYLDPTHTDFRYPYFRGDDHDTAAQNVMLGKHHQVPLPPPEDNAISLTRIIDLAADGTLKVRMETESNGPAEASLRGSVKGVKPEEYEKHMRAVISGMTADYELHVATFTDPLDFSAPFRSTVEYTLKQYASRSGKYLLLAVPKFELVFSEVALPQRKFDLVYGTTSLRQDDILMRIPDGFRVKYLPEPLSTKSPAVEFSGEYIQEGQAVRVKRRLALTSRRVRLADYQQHKEVMESISRFCEKRIFLEEIRAGGERP